MMGEWWVQLGMLHTISKRHFLGEIMFIVMLILRLLYSARNWIIITIRLSKIPQTSQTN